MTVFNDLIILIIVNFLKFCVDDSEQMNSLALIYIIKRYLVILCDDLIIWINEISTNFSDSSYRLS